MSNLVADIQKEQLIEAISKQKNMPEYMVELLYEGISKLGYEKIKKISKQIHQGKYKNKRKVNRPVFERDQVIKGCVSIKNIEGFERKEELFKIEDVTDRVTLLNPEVIGGEASYEEETKLTDTIDFTKYTNESCGKP